MYLVDIEWNEQAYIWYLKAQYQLKYLPNSTVQHKKKDHLYNSAWIHNNVYNSDFNSLNIHLSCDLSIQLPILVHLAQGYGSLIVYQRVAAHLLLEIGPN